MVSVERHPCETGTDRPNRTDSGRGHALNQRPEIDASGSWAANRPLALTLGIKLPGIPGRWATTPSNVVLHHLVSPRRAPPARSTHMEMKILETVQGQDWMPNCTPSSVLLDAVVHAETDEVTQP